mmetsp:Transcript_25928/g.83633  ORF Transcript_25928/g.83633 Transcript_25928/m.83633 type:complete len:212 (+) Transcript_25928:204-839(+)
MSSQLDAAIVQLLSSPRDVAKIALDTLCNLARNCIHKKEEKYHRIKMSNAAVKRKLLDVPGSTACLVALGFTEGTCEGEPAWLGPKGNKDMLYDGVARLGQQTRNSPKLPTGGGVGSPLGHPCGYQHSPARAGRVGRHADRSAAESCDAAKISAHDARESWYGGRHVAELFCAGNVGRSARFGAAAGGHARSASSVHALRAASVPAIADTC